MGTIPTIATAVAGTVATAAYMNSVKAASDFWALTPRAYVYQSSVTSVANSAATWTLLPMQAEVFDIVQSGDSPMHDTTTDPSRIYVRTTGKYEINGQVQIAPTPPDTAPSRSASTPQGPAPAAPRSRSPTWTPRPPPCAPCRSPPSRSP
jgi:hypothetical protein